MEESPKPKYSEVSGNTPHNHPLVWQKDKLVDHGKADKGPPHRHEIVQEIDGTWYLAEAMDDEEDPNHTHDIEMFSPESPKAAKTLSRISAQTKAD